MRRAASVLPLLAVAVVALAHCSSRTEIVLDIRTNAPCQRVRGAVVRMAHTRDDLDSKLVSARRDGCADNRGSVGTLAILPAGPEDAELAVQITLGLGRSPETCSRDDRAGCVVARRALRFVPGASTRVTVDMDALCEGRVCGTDETCERGKCVGIPGLPATTDPTEDDAGAGAPGPGADAAPIRCVDVCPQKGGACSPEGTCVIACKGADKCSGTATLCPAGVPCRIECTEPKKDKPACRNIMCPAEVPQCEIVCAGPEACADAITCEATARCAVTCETANTCKLATISVEGADNVIKCTVKDACKEANLACQAPGDGAPRDCRGAAATCGAPPCKCTLENGKPCGP